MAKQTREVTDPNEAFELLGIRDTVTDPDGNPVTTEQAAPPAPQEQPPAPEPQQVEPETQDEQPAETEAEETPPAIDEAEQKRRTWQAEADRAKAQAEQLEQQLRLVQAQNQQLMGVVTPFMQKYGMTEQQAPQQSNVEPEPDFIEDGYFDPEKYKTYTRKRDAWLENRLASSVEQRLQKKQEEQALQQQLTQVAKDFPEYVNPLTGQVDVDRLHRDLASYTQQKTLVDLLKEAKGIKSSDASGIDNTLKAIEKNANRPNPVVTSRESEKEPVKVPKKLKRLSDVFGDIELPPDFDGLIE